MAYGWLGMLFTVVLRLLGRDREREQTRSMAASNAWEQVLRERMLGGDWPEFDRTMATARRAVEGLHRVDANLLAANLELLEAEALIRRGSLGPVAAAVEAAIEESTRLPASERRELGLQARALAAISLAPGREDARAEALAREGLARHREGVWATTRARLAEGALCLGRGLRARSREDDAEETLRVAVEVAHRHEHGDARALAADAACDLARIRLQREDETGARGWLERAADIAQKAETPAEKETLARALVLHAMHLPGDALLDAAPRRARLERAFATGRDAGTPEARRIAAWAACRLANESGMEAAHEQAAKHFQDAIDVLKDRSGAEEAGLRLRALLGGAEARQAAQDPESVAWLRHTVDEALTREEPELRDYAFRAGLPLIHLMSGLGMHDGALEVRGRLEQAVQGLAPERRPIAEAALALERATAARRAGRAEEARECLAGLFGHLGEDERPEAHGLRWHGFVLRGLLAADSGDADEAVRSFQAALGRPDVAQQDPGEVARIELLLGSAHLARGESSEARTVWERAFERGSASGQGGGRLAAAQAAFQMGDLAQLHAERRRWFEAAGTLARLVRTPEAEALAHRASERAREAPGGYH